MSMSNRLSKIEESIGLGSPANEFTDPRKMTDDELERYLEAEGCSTLTEDLEASLEALRRGDPDPWVKIRNNPA